MRLQLQKNQNKLQKRFCQINKYPQENSSTTPPLPKALATAGESLQLVATSALQKLEANLEHQRHLILRAAAVCHCTMKLAPNDQHRFSSHEYLK